MRAELDGPKRRFLAGASPRRSGFEVEGARRTAKRRFRGDAETVQELDIARRAGVAKGTVFRHFATKEELIAAIVAGHITALTAVARRLLDSEDPGAALLDFLTLAADRRQQRDLTFLTSVSAADSNVAQLYDQLHAVVVSLVDRARESGAVRPDITGTGPEGAHPLPQPAPSWP